MTVICVVSSNRKALEVIGSGLSSVGLEPPNALEAGPIRTFDQWEEAVAGRTAASMQATLRPGRLWERLAMDLLLANLGKPAWYWMSGHSAAFLEFWSELEASVRFVLVCEAPELAIKRAMQSGDEDKLEETLLQWQAIQSQMLRFQHKRPDVSLLLSGPAQDRRPDRIWRQAHEALLQRGWMKPGRTPTPPSPSPEDGGEPQDPVLDYLVRAIVQERPEVLDLADEIRAVAPLLQGQDLGASGASLTLHVDDAAASTSETPTALELAKHYSRLVLSGKRETEAAAAARHELVHELEQERAEKAQALAELERQLQAAQKGQHEASEESELLLSQLHQVQEELEHYFSAHQDAKTTLKTIEGGVSRVLAQLPGAFDCEQFEVQARGDLGEEVDVSARAVRVPSGLRDKVGLSMRIDALGSLWLDVERDGSGACLERWPIRAAEESKLSFCPTALIDQSKGQLRLLAQLSASDWELV
jgi:molecular chaperone GrpE (heat shock protein)